jgi:(p)ppGpp synthase/HD superfamily hydrolase
VTEKRATKAQGELARLKGAIRFAAIKHAEQVDNGGQPYIGHPLRVMAYLLDPELAAQPDLETLQAAVLHDVVEDCGVTVEEIRVKFGADVAMALDALSRRQGETYFDYIRRCAQNEIAAVVKVADIRDNSDPRRGDYSWPGRHEKALAILHEEPEPVPLAALGVPFYDRGGRGG